MSKLFKRGRAINICMLLWGLVALLGSETLSANSIGEQKYWRELSNSKRWLRLLHYEGNDQSGFESQLDGEGFFFHPEGKVNPFAELLASAEAFRTSKPVGKLKLHPQCSFPQRFKFVLENISDDYERVKCPKLEEFMERFHGPTGATIVFSSAYPNNPASMFGHTFLKIRSTRKNSLIDMGVNFSAYTGPETGMAEFIYRGVFGGYMGTWSTDPYFVKVNEYVNSESRDLWEYDLALSAEETRNLLEHIWEMEVNSHFEYFFFDENCSYQILKAIEAIKMDWTISQHNIYVIPGETIKRVLDVPGAVREVRFRPSLFHQLELRYASLDSQQQTALKRLLAEDPNNPVQTTDTKVLDTATTVFLFEHARKKGAFSEYDKQAEARVLRRRSEINEPVMEPNIPESYLSTRPDFGHDPYSVHLGGGYSGNANDGRALARVKVKSAYHDLMANDRGYAPFSEIEFPWIEGEVSSGQVFVRELGLVSTTSLFPMTPFSRQFSWRIQAAGITSASSICQMCFMWTVEGGIGATLGDRAFRLYGLGLGLLEGFGGLPDGYRVRLGPELGWIWNPTMNYKLRLMARMFWPVGSRAGNFEQEGKFEHSYSVSRNQEIRQISLFRSEPAFDAAATYEIHLQWIQYFR